MHLTPATLLYDLAFLACEGPLLLLPALPIAPTSAMWIVRAVSWPARLALRRWRAHAVDYCTCGHLLGDHVSGTGRCRGEDDEGDRCWCPKFETGAEYDED